MIETERLQVVPLSLEHLLLLEVDRNDMEKNLGLKLSNYNYSEDVDYDLSSVIDELKRKKNDYLLYTYWEIILKSENKIIGEIKFSDTEIDDYVEIGYVTNQNYRRKGYMSEALTIFVRYLFNYTNIKTIKAIIDTTNTASAIVARKIGMNCIKRENGEMFWEISKKSMG